MVYFLNTNIKQNKKIKVAFSEIYGVGPALSKKICDKLGFNENIRFNVLNATQMQKISQFINENFHFGIELKQSTLQKKARLGKISSYRGFRHKQALPARGQRTHTNAKNARKLCFAK